MNFFKNDTEMLRRKPAQKQLGSSNLIKLYNISNHLDVIFSDLLPILRVTGVPSTEKQWKRIPRTLHARNLFLRFTNLSGQAKLDGNYDSCKTVRYTVFTHIFNSGGVLSRFFNC